MKTMIYVIAIVLLFVFTTGAISVFSNHEHAYVTEDTMRLYTEENRADHKEIMDALKGLSNGRLQ